MDILLEYESNRMEVEENEDDMMEFEDWKYDYDDINVEMVEEEQYEEWLAKELEGMGIAWRMEEDVEPMEESMMVVGSQ